MAFAYRRPLTTDRPSPAPELGLLPPRLSNRASELFKALGDPTRLRLLYLVAEHSSKEVCAHDLSLAVQVSAPTITHHMKKLSAARLVTRQQRGKWAYYSVNPEEFSRVHNLIRELGTHPAPLEAP